MTDRLYLDCPDVDELAGLYVLDALARGEAEEVAMHLLDHPERHPSFPELASVTPFIAESIEAIAPPPDLRARVMGVIAVTPQIVPPASLEAPQPPAPTPAGVAVPVQPGRPRTMPSAPPAQEPYPIATARARRRSPVWGLLAAAAVVAIVVLGGWNVFLQQQNSAADQRLALLTEAVAAAGQPGAQIAPMTGTDTAAGAGGYAVFPAEGTGYIVLTGMDPAPAGQTWQAWTIAETPVSAGLVTVGSDGLAVLGDVERVPGTSVVALTIEPAGGSEGPTTTPVVVGQLATPLAWTPEGILALVP
jgi:hypothetical protein